MQFFLAQTAPATAAAATAASRIFPPAPSPWVPDSGDLLRSGIVLIGTFLCGLVILVLLRNLVRRLRLGVPLAVANVAVALYISAWALKWQNLFDASDPVALWITRIFAAVMIYVLLNLLDRLAVVPILSRGGRVKMPRFIHQIITILLALFAILIYGSLAFGWDIDRFLAGSAVVSIVLGLALQETLGNFFSGLVMQASPPFAIGDWIICGAYEGRVVDMTWRAVTLHTNDDNFILIPNATVAKAEIVNYHAPSTSTARRIDIGLEADVVPGDAIAALKTAALETQGVQASPAPFVYLEKFGDSSVVYQVKFWINHPAQHHTIEHEVRVHMWHRLREKGIVIPNPTHNVEYVAQERKQERLHSAARAGYLEAIEQVPLLQPLSEEQKVQLADSASDLLLVKGQILFRQNEPGESFYIIRHGQVDVLATPDGAAEARQVATLGPGDFFGEMSALTGQPRTATIRAAAEVFCVVIEKRDLLAIFKADPAIMEKVSEVVATRNAQREAILQGSSAAPAREAVVTQQKSLLGRMMKFFRVSAA